MYDAIHVRSRHPLCWCLYVVFGLMVLDEPVWAQAQCLRWRDVVNNHVYTATTGSALASAVAAGLDPGASCHNLSGGTADPSGVPTSAGQNITYTVTYVKITGTGKNGASCGSATDSGTWGTFSGSAESYTCPDPEECDAEAEGDTFTSTGTGRPPASLCDSSSNCKANLGGVGVYLPGSDTYAASYVVSADVCPASGPTDPGTGEGEQCVTSGGFEVCHSPAGEGQCGYVNDEFVCVKKAPSGGCVVTGGGAKVCHEDADTPPVPDSGTPGEKATPDGTLEAVESDGEGGTAGNVYNYYNTTTVAGSSREGGDGGTPEGPAGSDGGDGEGEEGGGSSASGGSSCDAPPIWEGDAIQGAILEQEWRTRCVDAPAVEDSLAAAGLTGEEELPGASDEAIDVGADFDSAGWLGSRSCPADRAIDLGAYGVVTMPLSQACFFFQLIGNLVLLMAWLAAARIVVGGF